MDVAQLDPWFKYYMNLPLESTGIIKNDNEIERKENNILTKHKISLYHIHSPQHYLKHF